MADRGLFITLEGGEGAGKSTQIALLKTWLEEKGATVITTREPGGTPEAEKIRHLLVHREGGNWTPMAEVLLLYAARVMHVKNVIQPALDQGQVVICDRFSDSTKAYQSYGHGLPLTKVEEIDNVALGGLKPDLTLILDIAAEEGLKRSGHRLVSENSQEDRFENMDLSFHEKLRQGFLAIAAEEPERCSVIDATASIEDIADKIRAAVTEKLTIAA